MVAVLRNVVGFNGGCLRAADGSADKKALVPEKIGAYCDTKKLARID